jgi:hypothetical protein
MRGFIIFVLVAGVVFVYLRQKQNETPPATSKPVAAQMTPAPLAPAPRGQASEYNYMKRALDRARDVTEQSQARLQQGQRP